MVASFGLIFVAPVACFCLCNLATPLIRLSFCLPSRSLLRLNGSRADPLLPLRLLWQSSDFRHQVHRSPSVSRYNSFLWEVDSLLLPVVNIQHYLLIHFFFFKCAGEHGAVRVPRGGERGFSRGRFQAQSAASHQRWTRLEHPVAELGGHCCWEQVGGAASALSRAFHTRLTVTVNVNGCCLPTVKSWRWLVATGCCRFSPPVGGDCFLPFSWECLCQRCTAPPTLSWR